MGGMGQCETGGTTITAQSAGVSPYVWMSADFSALRGDITPTDAGVIVTRPRKRSEQRETPREVHLMQRYNGDEWHGENVGSWRCYQVDVTADTVSVWLRLKRMPR